MRLNLRTGYAGKCFVELLQLAHRDSETKKKLKEHKRNRSNTIIAIDTIKNLTAGTLYYSGQIVRNNDFL